MRRSARAMPRTEGFLRILPGKNPNFDPQGANRKAQAGKASLLSGLVAETGWHESNDRSRTGSGGRRESHCCALRIGSFERSRSCQLKDAMCQTVAAFHKKNPLARGIAKRGTARADEVIVRGILQQSSGVAARERRIEAAGELFGSQGKES